MRRIGFVVFPGYSMMGLAVASVFEVANMLAGKAAYDLKFLSEKGGPVGTSVGASISTEPWGKQTFDTLIIGGGTTVETPSAALTAYLSRAARRTRRMASICTGAFALAEAGLLDGRKATTHWAYARDLAVRYPNTRIEPDRIFINDGPVWTSAGMTAGIDLSLALVE